MKKRILPLFLTLCMVLSITIVSSLPLMAQEKSLVALGDSITTGYGLADSTNDCFVNLLSAQFGYTPLNMAVDGLTATQLATGLKSIAENTSETRLAIQDASVISITIGGNDLLNKLFLEIGIKLGFDPKSPTFKDEVISKVMVIIGTNDPQGLFAINQALAKIQQDMVGMCSIFAQDLSQIVKSIKQMNPTATTVLQTIPNPYAGITGLSEAFDKGVSAFNQVINAGAGQGSYKVADVYTAFKVSGEVLTNATDLTRFLDPHPNKEGHTLIAATVSQYLAIETTSVSLNIAWENDNAKIRPKTIEVQLYKDGTAFGKPMQLSETIGWKASWNDLDKSARWTVDEISVPDGYTKNVSIVDSAFTITNTHVHAWDNGVLTTSPSSEKDGVRTFTCTICGETKTEPVAKLPVITVGGNANFIYGSTGELTFTSDAALSEFLSITVDGKNISEESYKKSDDSTTITLTSLFLNTLSVGKHTVEINSKSGTAKTVFTVEEKQIEPINPSKPINPETVDSGNILFPVTLMLISAGVVIIIGINKKRKKINEK